MPNEGISDAVIVKNGQDGSAVGGMQFQFSRQWVRIGDLFGFEIECSIFQKTNLQANKFISDDYLIIHLTASTRSFRKITKSIRIRLVIKTSSRKASAENHS